VKAMLDNDYSLSIKNSTLPDELAKACITHQGKLEKEYEYLKGFL
jgi:hypothetical protein